MSSLSSENQIIRADNQARILEIAKLRRKLSKCKSNKMRYKYISKEPRKLKFYTGVTKILFLFILNSIKGKLTRCSSLLFPDHLLLVLMKLKLGLLNTDLAYRFGINVTTVSKIYRNWIPLLADAMLKWIIWPEMPAIHQNRPSCFENASFRNCVGIIDCTEIFIQRPLNLNARAQTWSNYKNTNTIKYFVCCSPAGGITFLSNGWGGRVSDKEITLRSGFMNKLQRGNLILADRGFQLAEEFAVYGAILKVPAFTKGKTQMSAMEVDKSRQISHVRIHIERVIGRMRKYEILNTRIPITQVDLLDHVMVAVAGLVNLNRSVVPQK